MAKKINIKIEEKDKQRIKNKSPDKMPLNPTAEGWSGQAVRKQLTNFVVGDKDSVLALVEDKLEIISDILETILTEEGKIMIDSNVFVGEDQPEEPKKGLIWFDIK